MYPTDPKIWIDELKVVSDARDIVASLLISTAILTALATWWLTSRIFAGQIKGMKQRLKLAKERLAFSDEKEIKLTRAIERQKAKKAAAMSKLNAAIKSAEADAALVDLEAANDTSAEVDAALDELKEANDSVEEALTAE